MSFWLVLVCACVFLGVLFVSVAAERSLLLLVSRWVSFWKSYCLLTDSAVDSLIRVRALVFYNVRFVLQKKERFPLCLGERFLSLSNNAIFFSLRTRIS